MKNYQEVYKQKLTSPDEAVKCIGSDTAVVAALVNGEPPAIAEALAQRILREEVKGIKYYTALSVRPTSIYSPEVVQKGTLIDVGYVGPVTRWGVQQGIYTFTPNHLSEVASYTWRNNDAVETAVCVVSPMDDHGYFSTGTNCDWVWDVAKCNPNIKNLIVEVNESMPRTHGVNSFHVNDVTAIVENHIPIVQLPELPMTKEDELIGKYIAEKIPDGACLQLGIGGIPNAVAKFLMDKRDLSVHTELFTDSMVDLFEAGVITNSKKNFARSKMVGGFAFGTQKLYDFINDNPGVWFGPFSYVNDSNVIALNNKMVSINATMEVDLFGQCASEAMGHKQYSGTGGQVDYVRGAYKSKGGQSFIALYSTYTDKEGKTHSKIKPGLPENSIVTTSRIDVMNIVTEYGIANLKGQNRAERARRLIQIAHPDFRDQLTFEAKKLNFFS